jgi:thioesterase domain-containing protein
VPRGPYVLGGYSHGGLVAFEMARQMTAAGHDVRHVLIIDIPPGGSAKGHRASRHLMRLRKTARVVTATLKHVFTGSKTDDDDGNWKRSLAWRRAQRAAIFHVVSQYAPGHYGGAVTVVVSQEGGARRSTDDVTLGWRAMAPNAYGIVLPGDHQTCVTTHTDTLARHIRSCLGT